MSDWGNGFYKQWIPFLYWGFLGVLLLQLLFSGVFFWQFSHQKLPLMEAVSKEGNKFQLVPHEDPSLIPSILLQWASKAAVAAYTFDFVRYPQQIEFAHKWFTDSGWNDYQASLKVLIQTISSRQLFVNSVVSAPPVIALTDETGWSVQLPFLVTYQSSDKMTRKNFLVKMKIVKVSTNLNPEGMGIAGFVMSASR